MKTQCLSGVQDARRSGVELLRILAALAVVVMHFNYYPGGSGAADYASGFSAVFLNFLECICISAVNVFLLISGAFGSRSKRIRIRKLALLLLQTMVFGAAVSFASGIMTHDLTVSRMLKALVPTNYYVTMYICLMLISPFINAGLERLSVSAVRKLVLAAVLVFSVYATLIDVLEEVSGVSFSGASPVGTGGSMGGYTFVHFALMYLLGAWLRREEDKLTAAIGMPLLAAGLALSAMLLYLWRAFLPGTAWMYSNPLVIAQACAQFMIFSRLRFSSRWINRVASAAFTCFLIQGYALYFLNFEKIGTSAFPILAGTVVVVPLAVYALSFFVYFIWNAVISRLFPEKAEGLTISAEG